MSREDNPKEGYISEKVLKRMNRILELLYKTGITTLGKELSQISGIPTSFMHNTIATHPEFREKVEKQIEINKRSRRKSTINRWIGLLRKGFTTTEAAEKMNLNLHALRRMRKKDPKLGEIIDNIKTEVMIDKMENFLDCLDDSGGSIHEASKKLGMAANNIYRWMEKYPEFNQDVMRIMDLYGADPEGRSKEIKLVKEMFLRDLKYSLSIPQSAKKVGKGQGVIHHHMERDPIFRKRVEAILKDRKQKLIERARQRELSKIQEDSEISDRPPRKRKGRYRYIYWK
jgi:hypothetical protein